MSEEKKNEVTEEVKEEARELSEEEIAQVNGGVARPSEPEPVVIKRLVTEPVGFEADDGR